MWYIIFLINKAYIIIGQSKIGVVIMSFALIFIIGLCTIQVMIIILFVTYHQKWVTKMNGMLISMSLGMTVGILMGTILGVILHGNMFESTVYAIIIGISVGFIAGIPIGLPAIIDGILSGLMGGMMGAMLGDMVAMSKPDATIKLMSFLVTMILVLVLYAAEESVNRKSKLAFSFFKHPFILIFIITILFIGLNYLGPI